MTHKTESIHIKIHRLI